MDLDLGRWWSDHWDFALAFIPSLLGLYYAIIAVRPSRISYWVRTDSPILTRTTEPLASNINVLYGTEVLAEPYLTVVQLTNTGRRALRESHFEKGDHGITVELEGARIVDNNATIVREGQTPEVLKVKQVGPSTLAVRPNLLNRGETLMLRMVSDGAHSNVSVGARFEDSKRKPRDLTGNDEDMPNSNLFRTIGGFGIGLFLFGVLFYVILFATIGDDSSDRHPILAWFASFTLSLGMVAIAIRSIGDLNITIPAVNRAVQWLLRVTRLRK